MISYCWPRLWTAPEASFFCIIDQHIFLADTSRNPKTGIRQGIEEPVCQTPLKSSNFVHPDNAVTAHPWRADHELFVGEVHFLLGFKEATGVG